MTTNIQHKNYRFTCSNEIAQNWSARQFAEALQLFEGAIGIPGWAPFNQLATEETISRRIDLSRTESIRLAKRKGRNVEEALELGFSVFLGRIPDMKTRGFLLCETGKVYGDELSLTLLPEEPLPRFEVFEQVVNIFRPRVAGVSESNNWIAIRTVERRLAFEDSANSNRPPAVHGWNYFGPRYVEGLGGMERVLATPAFRTRPYLEGAIIQLTEGYFDPDNQADIDLQRRAMEYLDIWNF